MFGQSTVTSQGVTLKFKTHSNCKPSRGGGMEICPVHNHVAKCFENVLVSRVTFFERYPCADAACFILVLMYKRLLVDTIHGSSDKSVCCSPENRNVNRFMLIYNSLFFNFVTDFKQFLAESFIGDLNLAFILRFYNGLLIVHNDRGVSISQHLELHY